MKIRTLLQFTIVLAMQIGLAAVNQAQAAGAEYEWVEVTMKAAFAPRDGAGALSYKGHLWLIALCVIAFRCSFSASTS